MDFEEKLQQYFHLKEMRSSYKDQMDQLEEEIEQHFNTSAEDGQLVLQLPSGEYAVLTSKATIKDEFEREALAQELLIATDELKTPFDYSLLTSQGKLTPDMISKHTHTRTDIKISIRKRKTKPRPKKR